MPLTMAIAWQRLRRVALIGIAGLVLLALVSVLARFGDIESDLESRARAALEEVGIVVQQVEFRGRDGVLRGIVGSEEDRAAALEIVEGMRGVRVVRDELRVLTPLAPTTTPTETTSAANTRMTPTTVGSVDVVDLAGGGGA